jgi:predicted HD phosphohydrolase
MDTVSFIRMADGTAEDYAFLDRLEKAHIAGTADRILAALRRLEHSMGGYQVSRYEHSLQTATRALRDGADEEMVVCALLHDLGDELAPANHGELAAAILRPYVSEENYWLVKHHGMFQGYYYFHHVGRDRHERERHRGHPAFEKTVAFCQRWDQAAFDPAYDTLPIEAFAPMVRRLFAGAPWRVGAS